MRLGRFEITLRRDDSRLSKSDPQSATQAVGDPQEQRLSGTTYHVDTLTLENQRDLIIHIDYMDSQVWEYQRALDILAEAAIVGIDGVNGGMQLSVSDETPASYRDAAKRVLQTVLDAPGLLDQVSLTEHARVLMKYGNVFIQPVYSRGKLVWGVQMPSLEMVRNVATGYLLDDPAYTQVRNSVGVIGEFKHWQICHLRTHIPNGHRYGRPFGLTSAAIHKRFGFVSSMTLTERAAAHPINVHYIDVTDIRGQKVRIAKRRAAYARQYRSLRSMPNDTVYGGLPPTDLYVTRAYMDAADGSYVADLNKIERITGNTGFADQAEMMRFYYTRFVRSLVVPPVMLGIVDKTFPQGYANIAQSSFVRAIRMIQTWLTQLPMQLLFNECVLVGLDPRQIVWAVQWPSPVRNDQRTDAYAMYTRMRADNLAIDNNVVDPRWVAVNRYGLTDIEYDEVLSRMQSEISQQEQQDVS